MGTMVKSPGLSFPPPFRAFRSLFAVVVLTLALAACAQSFQAAGKSVPGPAGAFAAATLSGGRIAILAGDDRAKAIYIIDHRNGTLLGSFGVTKEATGIAAQTEEGPLLLSIGVERGGRLMGAIEQWSLRGIKERIVPLPTKGLGITRVVRGFAYVLLGGTGEVRAAVPIGTPSLRVGRVVPLGAGAKSLQHCWSDDGEYLLYSQGDQGWLTVHNLESNGEARSPVTAGGETCSRDGSLAYAIAANALGRSVLVMRIPGLGPLSSIPASRDAIALYETDDHHLVALNSTRRVATIETFRNDTLDLRTASNELKAQAAR